MKVRNKNAKELKMDQDELDSKLRAMIEALDGFYGEYYTWDGRYSEIGQRYYEDLEIGLLCGVDLATAGGPSEFRRKPQWKLNWGLGG